MNAPAIVTNQDFIAKQDDIECAIREVQRLFDDGDLARARHLARRVYNEAVQASDLANKAKVSEELRAKARLLRANAVRIESLCTISIADYVDDAQAKGMMPKKGRPNNISVGNIFTLDDLGMSPKQLHEARALRDHVRTQPGFIDAVIQTQLDQGLEPSRAAVKHAIGTKTASKEDRGDNLYQTPIEGIRTLMARERFLPIVLEPSCGRGAISGPMGEAGYDVILSDLNDYATADRHGELQHVADFLSLTRDQVLGWTGGDDFDLVTNPPYGDVLNGYIAHALKRIKPRKMALLLNLNFLCGHTSEDRKLARETASRIIVHVRRLPMMHRDGWEGKEATSQMNTMWLIWERDAEGGYSGPAVTEYADYEDYASGPVMSPLGWADVVRAGEIPIEEDDEDFTRETPRVAMEDRVAEFRAAAEAFVAARDSVTMVELRKALSVRQLLAEALIADLIERGLILTPDGDGWCLRALPGGIQPYPAQVDDEGYAQALVLVRKTGKASAAMLQKAMQIRWYTANAHVERMERDGVVSAKNAAGRRQVLA
ncbi:hypothetical protein M2360_000911 [Rhizobium sp. SG_E_25_P2]|uniref:DNA translocase FtsK n=1 Tax=Rhizobium sp. SG_E_25_P2 TaxID=2879942 RepID=UPI0024748E9B|nr:DNA translocase FtsK [Rhizobium sp. SG_E_25_P2]MDH6265521.1 hypothetical protein [Rhizobium sp. SG_E_25_P2]